MPKSAPFIGEVVPGRGLGNDDAAYADDLSA